MSSGMSKIVCLSALLSAWLSGCAIPATVETTPSSERLMGKSQQDLLACAGDPLRVIPVSDGTVFRYYKEAPMLEESFVGSKGSKAGIHGGCWANVLLSNDRIVGVEYRPVPDALKVTDQCEEIFRSCMP
jgi:hypothetical protein